VFKFGIIGLFFIIGLMIIPVNFVSAQSDDSFVSTDRTNYQAGDIIHITGNFPAGNVATIQILNPNGEMMIIQHSMQRTTISPVDGGFEISFDTNNISRMSTSGTYVVESMSDRLDLSKQTTTFNFKISDKDQAELDAKEKDKQERIAQLEAKEKDEQKAKIAQLEAEQKEQQTKIAQLEAETKIAQLEAKLEAQEKAEQERIAQLEAEQNGDGCLIATATYGSEMSPQVQLLREIRDNQLMNTESGSAFMGKFNNVYYSFSPYIADMARESPMFKEVVKLGLTPMLSSLAIMENANSESEVISLGLSVIMLNLGMYLGVPAVLIVGIRKNS
jgi:hypothetical protein